MAIFVLWYNLAPLLLCWELDACILSVRKTDLKTEDTVEPILC